MSGLGVEECLIRWKVGVKIFRELSDSFLSIEKSVLLNLNDLLLVVKRSGHWRRVNFIINLLLFHFYYKSILLIKNLYQFTFHQIILIYYFSLVYLKQVYNLNCKFNWIFIKIKPINMKRLAQMSSLLFVSKQFICTNPDQYDYPFV